jgi:hypothetical protein
MTDDFGINEMLGMQKALQDNIKTKAGEDSNGRRTDD